MTHTKDTWSVGLAVVTEDDDYSDEEEEDND